jgi:hypothetical protein
MKRHLSSLRVVLLINCPEPAHVKILGGIGAGFINESQVRDDRVYLLTGKPQIWHSRGACCNECAYDRFATIGHDIGEIRTHVTAKAVELVAGYAIVLLVNLGAAALDIAHRGQMRGFGAFRVDVSGVKNEGNTQRAENGSIIDAGNSMQTR